MSRVRKAAITAGFTYAQAGLAIVSGFVLIPMTLSFIGARSWGLWLASGELLGYAGMTDLGVLGVLPWMIAEADGRNDRAAMRRLVGHGFWIGSGVGLAYAGVATLLWLVLPSILGLSSDDRLMVAAPFAFLVAANAFTHPFRVFRAVLGGLQDAWFNGLLSIVHTGLTMAITIGLMMNGFGLFALAIGAGVPPLVVFALCIARLKVIAPDLMTGWTRPTFADARVLLSNGTGVWLSAIGWQLLSASNAVVITFLGHPEWVPIYSCTAKLAAMTTQLTWVPPDSALVGLAHLYGERQGEERLRHVVLMMMRLHLLLGGIAMCGLLTFNPAFVTTWVGAAFFGGLSLNALLAIAIVVNSLAHGLATIASIVGDRLKIGVLSLVHGVVQTALAIGLGGALGLNGIALAGFVAAFTTTIPFSIFLMRPSTGLNAARLARELIAPWLVRAIGLVAAAAIAGLFYQTLGLAVCTSIAASICAAYVWSMRPLYAGLPLSGRWMEWLVRVRLVPPVEPARLEAEARGALEAGG
jgi:O-antigen/teichoic acid export membrane protein